MTQRPKDSTIAEPARVTKATKAQVVHYLQHHSDFLVKNPDLLQDLLPPARNHGNGVVDLQNYLVEKLRVENQLLAKRHDDLISTSRTNMTSQMRVHSGILALLEAKSFRKLIEAVTTDLAVHLDVDAVSICVEANEEPSAARTKIAGVRMLEPGEVDRILGKGRDIVLHADIEGDPLVYGAATGLVCSEALLRLHPNPQVPTGLLALGSRNRGRFDPGQGTELLIFLARSLDHCIRTWPGLPPD